jgi:hypothetical protein
MDWFGKFMLERPRWVTALIILALVALPVAVWLDLRNLSDQALRLQATSLDSIISEIRAYYSRNVVARVQQSPGQTQTLDNYHDVPGAIPIPATLSIELGDVISKTEGNIAYRFVSDFPFANRPRHVLDTFETRALSTFRAPDGSARNLAVTSGSIFDRQIRIVTPVIMGASCVACHNSHPKSPKHDWSVARPRGWPIARAGRAAKVPRRDATTVAVSERRSKESDTNGAPSTEASVLGSALVTLTS